METSRTLTGWGRRLTIEAWLSAARSSLASMRTVKMPSRSCVAVKTWGEVSPGWMVNEPRVHNLLVKEQFQHGLPGVGGKIGHAGVKGALLVVLRVLPNIQGGDAKIVAALAQRGDRCTRKPLLANSLKSPAAPSLNK